MNGKHFNFRIMRATAVGWHGLGGGFRFRHQDSNRNRLSQPCAMMLGRAGSFSCGNPRAPLECPLLAALLQFFEAGSIFSRVVCLGYLGGSDLLLHYRFLVFARW